MHCEIGIQMWGSQLTTLSDGVGHCSRIDCRCLLTADIRLQSQQCGFHTKQVSPFSHLAHPNKQPFSSYIKTGLLRRSPENFHKTRSRPKQPDVGLRCEYKTKIAFVHRVTFGHNAQCV